MRQFGINLQHIHASTQAGIKRYIHHQNIQ